MPVFPAGRAPARMAYGIARVLAQATPTPTMGRSSRYLSSMTATETSPMAPISRQRPRVKRRPSRAATAGNADEKAEQTAEFLAKPFPAQAKTSKDPGVAGGPP